MMLYYKVFMDVILTSLLSIILTVEANEDAKRLFDDIMSGYNRLKRPVDKPSKVLTIKLKLQLSQIIDVHEKDQIMQTSVWLKQEWEDYKLKWDPVKYGNVSVLYVPWEMIWVPDIVLYNNADGSCNITISTKATLTHTGVVHWGPPAVYKSMCQIKVQWFPFDEQECFLKFGSWSYTEEFLDLQHMDDSHVTHDTEIDEVTGVIHNVSIVEKGIDISNYYASVEWDILEIPATRHGKTYPSCCPGTAAYIDITYKIKLRRKPLFYTVNLIFPCVGISFLTILVFYLPSDSGEKISLSISILVSLTVFFLLLTEIIPATSDVLPLIGKYLLFTMVMVTLSVIVTVITLNIHFRSPNTHRMPEWVKQVFMEILPKYLFMRRPLQDDESFRRLSGRRSRTSDLSDVGHAALTSTNNIVPKYQFDGAKFKYSSARSYLQLPGQGADVVAHKLKMEELYRSPPVMKAFRNVCFIADLLKKKDKDDKIDEDWKFVAMVLDRLFLWIFSTVCFFGTVVILLQAPSLYDSKKPLTPRTRFFEPEEK